MRELGLEIPELSANAATTPRPRAYARRAGDTVAIVTADSDGNWVFEVLEETVVGAGEGWTWKVRRPGRTSRCESLDAVNVLLLEAGDLRETAVQDPYGHLYRPHRVSRGPLSLTGRHYLVYREEFPGDASGP